MLFKKTALIRLLASVRTGARQQKENSTDQKGIYHAMKTTAA